MNEQTPPQDNDAERSVLGALMLSREVAADVTDVLSGPEFYRPAHETIYRTITAMISRGEPVDAVTVGDALAREGEINRVGGHAYLIDLIQAVHAPSAGGHYAEIVARMSTRRLLASAGLKIASMAHHPGDEGELVELARKAVDSTSKATTGMVLSFGDTIDAMLDCLDEKANYHPSPWQGVNEVIGGFRPGAVYVVGARPSVGKSAIALQIAKELTRHGAVAFSSLEMSTTDVQIRAVAADLNIDLGRLMDRNLMPGDWAKIRDRRAAWQDVPLFIDDRSSVTITDIKRHARSVGRRTPLAGIVVDYLQLMAQPPGDKRQRHEFVADMSRQLKIMAMDMQVPVIVLSQLNRGSENRQDKEPTIADLRESGAIEQDADVVILLHREIMGENRGDLRMLIAKNRHGATGFASLTFWGHYSKALDPGLTPQAEMRAAA